MSCVNICVFQVRVRAFDNGSPPKSDIAVVKVTVNRNLHSPKFDGGEKRLDIFYTQVLGETITTVHATDTDKQVCTHNTCHSDTSQVKVQSVVGGTLHQRPKQRQHPTRVIKRQSMNVFILKSCYILYKLYVY